MTQILRGGFSLASFCAIDSSVFVQIIQCAVVIPASTIFRQAFLVASRVSCSVGGGILFQIRSVAFPWRMPVGSRVCGFLSIAPSFGAVVSLAMPAISRALVLAVHGGPGWGV